MKQKNEIMGNGHCDGMAALSLLFYLNQLKVEDFGGSSVNNLQLEGNQRLQREDDSVVDSYLISLTDSGVSFLRGDNLALVSHSFNGA